MTVQTLVRIIIIGVVLFLIAWILTWAITMLGLPSPLTIFIDVILVLIFVWYIAKAVGI